MKLFLRRSLLWLTPFVLWWGASPAQADWRFPVPTGWVDLSPGKPAPPGIPARELALASTSQAFAVDPASADDGYPESMLAKVLPQVMVPNERALAPFITAFGQGLRRETPDAQFTVVEKGIVGIQGVPAIRVVADITTPHKQLRILQFVIPGGDSMAAVAYTADARSYARYLPVFEANVRAIQGITAPPMGARFRSWLNGTWLGALDADDRSALFRGVGTVLGMSIFVALAAKRKRRESSASR